MSRVGWQVPDYWQHRATGLSGLVPDRTTEPWVHALASGLCAAVLWWHLPLATCHSSSILLPYVRRQLFLHQPQGHLETWAGQAPHLVLKDRLGCDAHT